MKQNSFFQSIKTSWILIFCFTIFPVYAEIPDAILLNQRTDLSIKNSKLFISRMYELQINNREGEEHAEIAIPYSKMIKVSKVEAYIKDKNGIIVKKLKSSDLKDRSSISDGSFYEDNFIKEFTLIHNIYPYTIFYSYQLQEDAFFYLDHWIPVLDKEIPTLDATLTLDVPPGFKIAYSSQYIESFKTDTIELRVKYTWKTSYTRQIEPEIYSPDLSTLLPKVVIVPLKFKYDQEGSLESWGTYGNWESRLLDKSDEIPEEEKQHVTSIIKGITNEKEKIKLLYHYLQDATRYVNISIETGGMKPISASEVSKNKYGDCKGLSNYFRSILSYVGIPSYYTNVRAGDVIKKLNPDFPSMQFNHVILCVPLPNDTIWLDCTSDGPFNYLGTFTQNRDAFVVEKDKSRFERTPALKLNDVLDIREVEFSEKSSNEVLARFENTYHGYNFEYLSSLTKQVNDNRKTQIVHEKYIETGFDPIDFKIIEKPRDSAFIQLKYTATTGRIYNQYGNEKIIRLLPFDIPDFNKPSVRKYPVQIDFPVYKSDTLNYQIPQSYSVTNKPENLSFNSEFGKYTIQYIPGNSKMRVIKSFALYAGSYTLKQYPAFYDFIKKVTELEKNTVIITNKSI